MQMRGSFGRADTCGSCPTRACALVGFGEAFPVAGVAGAAKGAVPGLSLALVGKVDVVPCALEGVKGAHQGACLDAGAIKAGVQVGDEIGRAHV